MKTSNGESIFSRREFTALSVGIIGTAMTGFSQNATLTAGQVIDRIKEHLGVPWRGGATDTFKAGDPDTPGSGIATTVMATFDVIKRAAASGKNMGITHEPTDWLRKGGIRKFPKDPRSQKKLQGHSPNKTAIWR